MNNPDKIRVFFPNPSKPTELLAIEVDKDTPNEEISMLIDEYKEKTGL